MKRAIESFEGFLKGSAELVVFSHVASRFGPDEAIDETENCQSEPPRHFSPALLRRCRYDGLSSGSDSCHRHFFSRSDICDYRGHSENRDSDQRKLRSHRVCSSSEPFGGYINHTTIYEYVNNKDTIFVI